MGDLRAIPRIIASVVLLGSTSARSEGLRGISIGEACTAAFEVEVANGSRPSRPISEIHATDVIGFQGTHGGRPALIAFNCADGIVSRQLVAFTLETEPEARTVFEEQYAALVDHFGAPCTDWRKLTFWQRFKLWIYCMPSPDALGLGVDWKLHDDLWATLSTSAMGKGPDSWSVMIGVSGPPNSLVREADGSEHGVASSRSCLTNP